MCIKNKKGCFWLLKEFYFFWLDEFDNRQFYFNSHKYLIIRGFYFEVISGYLSLILVRYSSLNVMIFPLSLSLRILLTAYRIYDVLDWKFIEPFSYALWVGFALTGIVARHRASLSIESKYRPTTTVLVCYACIYYLINFSVEYICPAVVANSAFQMEIY